MMSFKKILALLLAVMMLFSFAACGAEKDNKDDDQTQKTEPQKTEPQETEPQETEPQQTEPQGATLTMFEMSWNTEDGSQKYLMAFPSFEDPSVADVRVNGDVRKEGMVSVDALNTIAEAAHTNGLEALNGKEEGEYSEFGGTFMVIFSDETVWSASFYGEVPQEFADAYAAMESCFATLTAELPEYVPAPMESGEITDNDRNALNAILGGMTLVGSPEQYAIQGIAKDEFFATALRLSSDEGVASGLQFMPQNISDAYRLRIVTLEEGADANAVAENFKSAIDWHELVCVHYEDVLIASKDNQVLCLLGSGVNYASTVTAIEAAGWTTIATLHNPDL